MVDLSIGGWKLTTESAAELAHDISCVLEDAEDNSFTIVLHLFDNSIYKGLSDGELTDAFKLKGSYHIKGELQLISSTELKSLFETALPIMRACSGSNIILLGPLPRYVNKKCCDEASHITNFGTPEYVASMASSIREMGKQLRNMAHIRRLKNTKVKNPAVLMGVLDSTEISPPPPKLLELYGTAPVHLTPLGYAAIASRLADELQNAHVVHTRLPANPPTSSSNSSLNKSVPRESWTAGTPVVVHRNSHWADNAVLNRRGCGGARGSKRGYVSSGGRGSQGGR